MKQNYKNPIVIGEVKIAPHLQTKILVRALGEAEVLRLWEQYSKAKLVPNFAPPTEEQRALADAVKNGLSVNETARKFSVDDQVVSYSIKRVAIHDFLHPTI